MNTYKLKGNTMISGIIISPEIPIAVFNNSLIRSEVKNIVNNLNFGPEMLYAYAAHRDDMHISNVLALLHKLEHIHNEWDREIIKNERNSK
jgi:hypothetical protein